jgi:hypothetical protein
LKGINGPSKVSAVSPNGAGRLFYVLSGGFAASGVIDDEINLDLVPYGLDYDFCDVLNYLRIQHSEKNIYEKFLETWILHVNMFLNYLPLTTYASLS